jgi:DNA-binding response OmpR family regulator
MTQVKKSLGKSEITLIKDYCSRISEDDLDGLARTLPQNVAGDRSHACSIIQKDKEMDRWLSLASGADDWFLKADSIGEFASIELDARAKKSRGG